MDRLQSCGPNGDGTSAVESFWRASLRRMLQPLSLILLGAGIVSVITGDSIGGSIIVAILVLRSAWTSSGKGMRSRQRRCFAGQWH